jgi:hypothetical protein
MRICTCLAIGLLALGPVANAATIVFDSDPFAGTDVLDQPGRQIVGGLGPSIDFNIATDVFAFDPVIFGVNQVLFANGLAADLPPSGINVAVLQDTGTPLLAGTAANRIADAIEEDGPGFFIYFNTNLDLPRLVYSTNLNDNTADLAVLARMVNLSGPGGFAQLPSFTAANFEAIPEPSTLSMMLASALLCGLGARRWRARA